MTYALRKLIAFVFLGGLFWFIYQDLDNLDKPWFMHALGMIVILFAFFWLLVPIVVVRLRIMSRRRQNRANYLLWKKERGGNVLQPLVNGKRRFELEVGEVIYWHEKGTLYAHGCSALDALNEPMAEPSEVAFPHFGVSRHLQRTHFYVTNHRVILMGKGLSQSYPLPALVSVVVAPGGLIFAVRSGTSRVRLAVTCRNPIIVNDVLHTAKNMV